MSLGRDIDSFYFGLEGEPITHERWLEMWENTELRRIASDDVGPYRISTVWLGINHSFGDGPPVIFETMVFHDDADAPLDGWQERYCTREGAERGHQQAVDLVNAAIQLDYPDLSLSD